MKPQIYEELGPILRCVRCCRVLEPGIVTNSADGATEIHSWNDAIVGSVQAGYGSKFDLDKFTIGICDTCIDTLKRRGEIIHKPQPTGG